MKEIGMKHLNDFGGFVRIPGVCTSLTAKWYLFVDAISGIVLKQEDLTLKTFLFFGLTEIALEGKRTYDLEELFCSSSKDRFHS